LETAQEPNSVNNNNNSTEKLRYHTRSDVETIPSHDNKTINYSKLITYL